MSKRVRHMEELIDRRWAIRFLLRSETEIIPPYPDRWQSWCEVRRDGTLRRMSGERFIQIAWNWRRNHRRNK
jgi:hypothetical protein